MTYLAQWVRKGQLAVKVVVRVWVVSQAVCLIARRRLPRLSSTSSPRCLLRPPATKPTQVTTTLYPSSYSPLKRSCSTPRWVEGDSPHTVAPSHALKNNPCRIVATVNQVEVKQSENGTIYFYTVADTRCSSGVLLNGMCWNCYVSFTPSRTRSLP